MTNGTGSPRAGGTGEAAGEPLEIIGAPDRFRGLVVVDPHGHRVGEVEHSVVEKGSRDVRVLVVGSGGLMGLGRVRRSVPIEAVADVTDRVHITISHQLIHDTVPLEPDDPRVDVHAGQSVRARPPLRSSVESLAG